MQSKFKTEIQFYCVTKVYKGYKDYEKKACSQEVRLLACSQNLYVHEGRNKAFLFSRPRKADTLLKPAEGNREA